MGDGLPSNYSREGAIILLNLLQAVVILADISFMRVVGELLLPT